MPLAQQVYRAHRRFREKGDIGMPDGIVAHIGHGGVEHQHFGLPRHAGVDRMDVQVTELVRQPGLLGRRQWLVAPEQDLVGEQRSVDLALLRRGQFPAQVDAFDDRADGGAQGGDVQSHVGQLCW